MAGGPFRSAYSTPPASDGVARLPLQPGERELVRLRPAVGAFLPRYLGGLALLAWAALVLWGPGMEGVFEWSVGGVLVAAAPLLLGGAALYLPRRRLLRLALALLGGVAVLVAPAALGGLAPREACAAALAAAGLVALALAETDRRLRAYRLTNLRILHRGGLWERRPWTLHYDAILDLDARQTPLGRLLGHGTLEPILEEPKPQPVAKPTKRRKATVPAMQKVEVPGAKPRLWGVRPLGKVHALVEAFVQDATATEYLRAEQQTQRRVGQAMADLGRANLLR
jgi:hypothetical protein